MLAHETKRRRKLGSGVGALRAVRGGGAGEGGEALPASRGGQVSHPASLVEPPSQKLWMLQFG